MSTNASLIQRMHALVDRFQARELEDGLFIDAIYSHLQGLEFTDFLLIQAAGDLCCDFVGDSMWREDEPDNPHALKKEAESLAKFRKCLDQLPTTPA